MARRTIPLLVLISAPSGAGKTTLVEQILAARPAMRRAVTCTTRPPRPGERNGTDYHFLSEAEFERGLRQRKFLEHARVYGHRYGLWRSEVLKKLRAGTDVLINLDVQGVATLRGKAVNEPELRRSLVTLFLTPASLGELEQRLRKRGTDPAAVIARRLRAARRELRQWSHFDYLVLSETRESDLRRALTILDAEKLRTTRSRAPRGD